MNKDQKPQKPLPKSDMEVLKQYHQFVRDDEEDIDPKLSTNDDYGRMIARKYYDKLYKEYAIIDLSQYKTGKIGMRWRTEPEVMNGKGETICGNKVCTKDKELSTWELNFQYKENQEVKNTLVKVKCCHSCSQQLNYKVFNYLCAFQIETSQIGKRVLRGRDQAFVGEVRREKEETKTRRRFLNIKIINQIIMQSNYKIEGRKSPKTIVGLEQKINQYFSNKIQEKQIVADIISRPQLEEIIPFSEILNQKRMKYSNAHNPLHQKQLHNTQKKEKNKQIKYHTSRSNTSNQHNRDQKSQKPNQKIECCSCFCFGCSKRNSTRIKKPRTPQVKGEHYYVNYTNKTSESNQAIKQYSIAKSQSRCIQHQIRHHQSEQRKQNIQHNCCKINHLANPKLSQAISQYSESAKQYTQREYLQIQQQLQNYCDAKKRYSSTKEQKQKDSLRTHMQKKIEEGKLGQAKGQKLSQLYKELTKKQMIKYRSTSNQNKIQVQQEQNHMNYKTIEKGKQITKVGQQEKDKKKFKQVLDIFKKNKMQNNIIKNNYDILQNNPEQNQIENKVSSQQKIFESKSIEKTFKNNQPHQLVELK